MVGHPLGNQPSSQRSAVRVAPEDTSSRLSSPSRLPLPSNRRRPRTDDDPVESDPGGSADAGNCAPESASRHGRDVPKVKRRGALQATGDAIKSRLPWLRTAASLVFVVAASIALAWGIKQHVTTSPRFAVKTVRVDGTARRTPEQISATAGISIGMNIFSVDLEAARRRLLQDPWVASADVERHLPSTLTMTLTEREAAAVVAVDADLYVCTPEGEMFKKLEVEDPIGLPVITGLTASLVSNDRKLATARVRSALELIGQYGSQPLAKQYPIQEVRVADDGSIRLVVGSDVVMLEMGKAPYRMKVQRAARVMREVQKQKADPSIVFLDNEAHPERVVVRMR